MSGSEGPILVVDDETAIRLLLRSALTGLGREIWDADCGEKALELARERAFALVVSDVLMPGMDGIELARELASSGRATRFLFISGYFDLEATPERLSDLPVAAFLTKPFKIPELLRTARMLLEHPRAARPARAARARVTPRIGP